MKTKPSPHSLLRLLRSTLPVVLLLLAAGLLPAHAEALVPASDTPVNAAPARELPVRLRGHISQQSGDAWVIFRTQVDLSPSTKLTETTGPAVVGAYVEVVGVASDSGRVTASEIIVLYPAGAAGPIVELSGVVSKIAQSIGPAPDYKLSRFWVVGGQPVVTTEPETLLIGEPSLGSLVWVVGVSEGDTVRALAIDAIANDLYGEPVSFEGRIDEISDERWVVDGHNVTRTAKTLVLGVPVAGATAEVSAREDADGSLTGLVLRAVDPATEAYINAVVSRIEAESGGAQTWSVITFKGTGADIEATAGSVQVTPSTYVEERRTALRVGVYAEIDGQRVDADTIKAELVRLDRPTPVMLSGPIGAPAASGVGEFWTVGGQRVWSSTPQVTQAFRSAQAVGGLRVTVRGVRLGNGIVWVQQAVVPTGNMR